MRRWFAVHAQPRRETLALAHLERQGFEAFLPQVRHIRRIGTKRREVLEPFFASYLFACLDPAADRWRSINGTIGVRRLVCFGDVPAPLPAGFVENLQGSIGQDGELRFDEQLGPGDQVRIVGGPLGDRCGILFAAGPGERVTILLDLLGAERRVVMTSSRLRAA